MDTSAPWRELEEPGESPSKAAPTRPKPSALQLMLAAAAILAIGSLALLAFIQIKPGGQVDLIAGPSGTALPKVAGSQAVVVVQVAGAVLKPGVYTLPAGSRVGDAIQAAGGYSADVDPRAAETKLNLAAKLQDAQLIAVPRKGDTAAQSGSNGAAATRGSAAPGPVNLNTATATQLDALPGIGPATAAKIIASREELPFTAIDDLVTRKLVTAATLAKFRGQVGV
jgi:competence protein ComEA